VPERARSRRGRRRKFAVRKVRDARGETKAQEMCQSEDVVAHAAAVRMMDGNAEIRLVIEQPIYDVCRFARGRNGWVWNGAWRDKTWV
jgi:hypothetical protein